MTRVLAILLLAGLPLWQPNAVHAQSYDFPFVDGLVATVIGTPELYQADLPRQVEPDELRLRVFPERETPEVFWYTDELRVGVLTQRGPAPLVFIIAGTGAGHDSGKVKILFQIFEKAGFHAISVPSPTHMNFIVNASTTSVPGAIAEDSADIYRVMQMAYERVKDRIEVTGIHLTGYSLGAAQAAFVAKLDEAEGAIGFDKILMINPPVSLYNSALILDAMLDNNTPDGIGALWDDTMTRFAKIYAKDDEINFSDSDFLYKIYRRSPLKDEQLEGLIGFAFRLSSAGMIFTSDVTSDFGFIAPPSPPDLTATQTLSPFAEVAMRTSFNDYINDMFVPFFQRRQPGATLESLVFDSSLESIEDFLIGADQIGLMHNEDDPILAPGELDYLERIFGDRAQIYNKGGHCGNMNYPDNVAYMIQFFGGPSS